jgi:aminoethylphosphonate catabolism LysR family transcriptional regulator
MRYVQLKAFHYVAMCGGFSRAAEALNLTQPAISDQVRKLEAQYDVLLFNRFKKRVVPTATGRALLEITRRMFDFEQQASDLLSESQVLRSGTLRIVADAAHHLLPILARFRDQYPKVRVALHAGNTEAVIASLYAYEADIGVLSEVPRNHDFKVLKLNSTPIIAFAATGYPAAARGKLSLRQLAKEPLVMREVSSKTRQKLERAAAAHKVELRPAIEAEGREAVREIVASGAGIGFVSAAEFGNDDRLRPIAIDGDDIMMDEMLVWLASRGTGRLIRTFHQIAKDWLRR